jgi:hypothetical protein
LKFQQCAASDLGDNENNSHYCIVLNCKDALSFFFANCHG